MRKNSFLLLFLCVFAHGKASGLPWPSIESDGQDNQSDSLEIRFDSLERRYQKHGCLRENCIEFTDLDCFMKPSICDSNTVTRPIYSNLLRSASTLQNSPSSWTVEDVQYSQSNASSPNTCPISVLQYMYIQFKENALTEGLVKMENGFVKDVFLDGIHQDPYEDRLLFAFSPSDTIFYNNVTFTFPSDIRKGNMFPPIEFDADDGMGFRQVSNNGSITVNYQTGSHHLKMRMNYNSTVYYAHCYIQTVDENFQSSQSRSTSDELPETVCADGVEGLLARRIRTGNVAKRPFLIVEGFDPRLGGNLQDIGEAEGKKYGSLGYEDYFGKMDYDYLFSNFDVYYLDFKDCTISIKENAKLLERVIDIINGERDTCAYKPVIMGSSMGGLVARYCLRNMELRGKSHQVSTLICQDTPNLGANVPLGILYAAHGMLKIYNRYISQFWNLDDEVSILRKYVYCQSAKEMLYNFVDENGNIDNSTHTAFLRELNEMGYPCGDDGTLRCIAISNGNEQITSFEQSYLKMNFVFEPSVLVNCLLSLLNSVTGIALGYVSKNLETGLLGLLPGTQKVTCKAEINPIGTNRNICDIRLTYKKKIFGIFNAQKTFYELVKPDVSMGVNYDLSKGSYFDTRSIVSSIMPSEPLLDTWYASANIELDVREKFLFVPTASALDIGEGIANLTQADYNQNYDMQYRTLAPKHSPFHAYYISGQSEQHISMNENIVRWLLNQMRSQVSGDAIGSSGTHYAVTNITADQSVAWFTSSPDVATIDANGTLTQHSHGYTTITGQLSNGMQFSKRIMVGLPPYTIEPQYSSSGYCVKLALNTDYNEYSRYQHFIHCNLAVRNSSNQLEWTECPQMYHWVALTDDGTYVPVYYRLRYTNCNNEDVVGPTVYYSVNTSKPYIIEPNYFAATYFSEIRNVTLKRNPLFTGTFTNEFKIYNFESHGGVPPSCGSGLTEMVLTPQNVFPSAQIQSFMSNSYQHSISNDFIIRNYQGTPIQHFYISIIKP